MPRDRLERCALLVLVLFAVASLGGCTYPETAFVDAEGKTYDLYRPLIERKIQDDLDARQRIEAAREVGQLGDADATKLLEKLVTPKQAEFYHDNLEWWKDDLDEAGYVRVKAPEAEPPKPTPPHDGPVPATSPTIPDGTPPSRAP